MHLGHRKVEYYISTIFLGQIGAFYSLIFDSIFSNPFYLDIHDCTGLILCDSNKSEDSRESGRYSPASTPNPQRLFYGGGLERYPTRHDPPSAMCIIINGASHWHFIAKSGLIYAFWVTFLSYDYLDFDCINLKICILDNSFVLRY